MPNELLGWDADFYKTLSDTTRNVSLSDKEIYVLGNLLPMVSWSNRWSGDLTGLDIDAIRGEMEFTILDEIEGGGGTMSCVDLADCIETDEAVQNAIEESITNNGFTPNADTDLNPAPPPKLTPTAKTANLLPDGLIANCEDNPQWAMGLARAIVKELHESAEDLFEALEYVTNLAEAAAQVAEQIPVVGNAVNGAIEFVDWLLETMNEVYLASYNQASEDELSCAIFCHIMANCSLSIDDLIGIYENEGSITIPPLDNLEAVMTFAISYELSPNTITVAIFHYQILRMISWGSFAGFTAAYLKSILTSNVSAYDYSYQELCEDCPQDETPDTYWRLFFDFRISGQGWEAVTGSGAYGADYVSGWQTPIPTLVTSQTGVDIVYNDLGDNYQLVGSAQETQRRGSTGNGTTDTSQNFIYTGANRTGTQINYNNYGSITESDNSVIRGFNNTLTPSTAVRSVMSRARVGNGASAYPTRFARILRVVYYGLPLESGTKKPPRSTWVDSVPETVLEMLPDGID